MIAGVRIKVCGLTNLGDVEAADAAGADALGFIAAPASPRFVPWEQLRAMRPRLPPRRLVCVLVEPSLEDLGRATALGFSTLQVHFPVDRWREFAPRAVEVAGGEHVWLAPRLADGAEPPAELLELGRTFLIDGAAPGQFGGTGRTADWSLYARLKQAWKGRTFILAGGLRPENVAEAMAVSGARWLDVNSGIERAPGLKDPDRLAAFFAAVRDARGS